MHTLKVKLVQVGTSTGMVIPAQIARLFGFAPGATVRARFTAESKPVERPVISMSGGRSVGVLVPVELLEAFGWTRGDEVEVPFLEWKLASGTSDERAKA